MILQGQKEKTRKKPRYIWKQIMFIHESAWTIFQTLDHLWRPNLEIYGLEDFQKHKILGEMAGLRITKDKRIKYDIK